MTLPSGLVAVVRSMLIVAVLLLISSGAVDPGLKFSAVYGLTGCGLMYILVEGRAAGLDMISPLTQGVEVVTVVLSMAV